MQSAKPKLSTRQSLLFQSYRARSMQAQFLPNTVIYWYAIETHCKLDHTFLKRKQTPILFVNPSCKSNHTSNKIYSYETRSKYINLEAMLCWPTIYLDELTGKQL